MMDFQPFLARIIAFLAKFDRLKSPFLQKITCNIGRKIQIWLQAVQQNLSFEKNHLYQNDLKSSLYFFSLQPLNNFPILHTHQVWLQ